MRLAWTAVLLAVGCSPLEPFRLALDLPSGAVSAVVRVEAGAEVTVGAVDLLTGSGADTFLRSRYADEPVQLTAFTYLDALPELGIKAGKLTEVAEGRLLPAPIARLTRQATLTSTGGWRAATKSPLDEFRATLQGRCTDFTTEVIPLDTSAGGTVVRGVETLSGDLVVAASSDGILYALDVQRRASVLTKRYQRPGAHLHAMTVGPDHRIWLSVGETEQPPTPPFDVLVETSTGGFRALPRRTAETFDDWELRVMAVDPRDPARLLGLTVSGALLSFDERTGRWTKLLDPQNNDRTFCGIERKPTNQYCGAIHFEGDAILAFDPTGRRQPRRYEAGSVSDERVLDSPTGGLPTVISRTQLGLTMLRSDAFVTSILVRSPAGRWTEWLQLESLRMYTVASVDERRLLLGGAEGSGLELIDKDVCQHLPGLSFNNYGHMAQTPHAFVMSTADDRYNDQTSLYVYWID